MFRVCSLSAEHMRSSLIYYSTSAKHWYSVGGINISYDFVEIESKNRLNLYLRKQVSCFMTRDKKDGARMLLRGAGDASKNLARGH